jgi:GNAT superfamily N-acetyltransferase
MPSIQIATSASPAGGTETSAQNASDTVMGLPSDAAHLSGILVLHDGSRVHARPIQPSDTELLRTFHAHLSRDTVIFRFFHYMPELSLRDAEHFTHVDYNNRMALIATLGEGDQERILAVVRYERLEPVLAEVAFVVADEWQGHGIATALLLQLAAYARARSITRLVAVTMASNMRMLEVLRHCGYPITIHSEHGEDKVFLDISRPPAPVLDPVPFIPASGS